MIYAIRGLIFLTNESFSGPRLYPRAHLRPDLSRQTYRRLLPTAFSFFHKIETDQLCTAEDNMNVQLRDITVTARDGRVSHLDQVYIRGSHVRFFIVPDMLR